MRFQYARNGERIANWLILSQLELRFEPCHMHAKTNNCRKPARDCLARNLIRPPAVRVL